MGVLGLATRCPDEPPPRPHGPQEVDDLKIALKRAQDGEPTGQARKAAHKGAASKAEINEIIAKEVAAALKKREE